MSTPEKNHQIGPIGQKREGSIAIAEGCDCIVVTRDPHFKEFPWLIVICLNNQSSVSH